MCVKRGRRSFFFAINFGFTEPSTGMDLYVVFLLFFIVFLRLKAHAGSYQQVRIDVMTSAGTDNLTMLGLVSNAAGSASVPDDGIVGVLIGSRTSVDGCVTGTPLPANHSMLYSPFADSYVALMQRNRCNFAQAIQEAEARGFSAILTYDPSFNSLPAAMLSQSIRNLTIPLVYLSFLDGRLLWKKFQYFTGAYVVITATNAVNTSLTYSSLLSGPSSTPSSDVANVLLGFIPAVSYVCIVLSVILIIIARRFIHCSLFVVYKMAMHHNPKVTPVLTTQCSKTEVSSMASRCTICLEEFRPTELIHAILPCQHVFHQHCIDQWLRKGKLVCPLCRRKITLKKIIRHVFLNHDNHSHPKGHIFVIPSLCRPTSVSDSTIQVQTTYPT